MTTGVAFDGEAMIRALDEQRVERGLDWNGLAAALYDQSSDLNAELADNHLCQGALVRTARRGTMSCQYALIILRWLERPAEDFLTGEVTDVGDTRVAEPGPGFRLRWDLGLLHQALSERRRAKGQTWAALGAELGCTPARLTNLRTARLADMGLTMRVAQHVAQPAAAFIRAERW